jgi:signal transduction histidine kinase
MAPHERRMWLGYGLVAACLFAFGVVSIHTVNSAVAAKERIIAADAEYVLEVERLRLVSETLSRKTRSYHLTGNQDLYGELSAVRGDLEQRLSQLEARMITDAAPASVGEVREVRDAQRGYDNALRSALKMRERGSSTEAIGEHFDKDVAPWRERLDRALSAIARRQAIEFEQAKRDATEHASRAVTTLSGVSALAALVAGALGLLLSHAFKTVHRQRVEVEQSLERVAASNRDLDAFAARVAHDLKNILAPLPMAADRLKTAGDERFVKLAERLERLGTRAADMTDSLLAFSRAVHLSAAGESASVEGVVREVLEQLEPLIASADATIELDIDERVRVGCSPGLLTMVTANLLNNAVKFLERESRRLVKVAAHSRARWCELIVEDTGPGIPEAAQSKIFEPFYRLPSSRAPGTGIGLATVQRIVQAHGGRIVVESEVGKGTSFHVWLPLAAEEPATSMAARDTRNSLN